MPKTETANAIDAQIGTRRRHAEIGERMMERAA